MDVWVFVRFVHVAGAALWVGGQLALALVITPLARRMLGEQEQRTLIGAFGRRFARITLIAALPLQVVTGVGLAVHNDVTWASLAEPGYGRTLAAKLGLLVLAMAAAAGHGVMAASHAAAATGETAAAAGHGLMAAKRKRELSRSLSVAGLVCSLGVVLLATALAG